MSRCRDVTMSPLTTAQQLVTELWITSWLAIGYGELWLATRLSLPRHPLQPSIPLILTYSSLFLGLNMVILFKGSRTLRCNYIAKMTPGRPWLIVSRFKELGLKSNKVKNSAAQLRQCRDRSMHLLEGGCGLWQSFDGCWMHRLALGLASLLARLR